MAVGSILMTFLIGLQDGIHNTMYFILPGLLGFWLMMKYMPDYKHVMRSIVEKSCSTN